MELARYAKQSLHEWDDVEVMQIRRWIWQLQKILEKESDVTRATED